MAFDYSKLQGRIVEKFGTRRAFAAAAGMTDSRLSARLNNLVPFTDVEIIELCSVDLLDINLSDVPVYFFTLKVE